MGQRTIAQTTHRGIPPVWISDMNGLSRGKEIWARRLFAVGNGHVFLGHSVSPSRQNRLSFMSSEMLCRPARNGIRHVRVLFIPLRAQESRKRTC